MILIRLDIKNEKIRQEFEHILSAEQGVRLLRRHDDRDPCDLLIFEIEKEAEKDFQWLQHLQASGRVKEIFLTSPHVEPGLLLQAMRAGIKEFFSQPLRREEITSALVNFRERVEGSHQKEKKRKRGKLIYVIGSKGGVGTTTIAVNLSANLCESNGTCSVALMDLDLPFGQVPTFLNIETSLHWGEVLRNMARVDEMFLMGALSRHHSGIYVLPSPPQVEGIHEETPADIEKLLDLMRNLFDFILIDGGQHLSPLSLKLLQISDVTLLVTVLNLPALANTKKLLWTFHRLGFPPKENLYILANRYQKKTSISVKEAEEAVNEKIHWLVGNDYHLTMSAINQGKTISEMAYGSEVNKSLRDLAKTFLSKDHPKGSR